MATAEIRGPWDLTFGAKLTLATPTPVNSLACIGSHYPTGSNCTPIAGTAPDVFGYRDLDLQVTKNFKVAKDQTAYVRLELLNILDIHNYSDANTNWGSNGVLSYTPVTYNTTGNINGVPFTARLQAGYKF